MNKPINSRTLQERAELLWKSPELQQKWLKAVEMVRSTSKGWVLDGTGTLTKQR